MEATFQYCLDNHFLGVGWRVPEFANTRDWGLYESAAEQEHNSIQQPRYIYQNVTPNDLVWTRDPEAGTTSRVSHTAGSIGQTRSAGRRT